MKSDAKQDMFFLSFREYLGKNSLTLTAQRKELLNHILSGPVHFNIEEMVDCVRRKHAGISRSTIYRTITHLEKAGLVRKMDFDENHAHYEVSVEGSHHEHLVCNMCGAILEFTDNEMENRITAMADKYGFIIKSHKVQIIGICKSCNSKTVRKDNN